MADGSAPLLALARVLIFWAAAIVAPGVALQRLLRVRIDPALVLPLGLASCALGYWLSLLCGQPLVFPLLVAAAVAAALLPGRRQRASGPSLRGALPPLALLVSLFALTQYGVNRVDHQGRFLLDVGEHVDTALHVGLSFELVAGYPPQVPGLAGVPIRYHVGSHLVRAAAARWAGVHPYDAMNRFDITLWAAALVLALRAAAAALGLGTFALRLAGFLPLAADLSFVPGLLGGSQWWVSKLGGNLVEPLFFANSIVPALALALAAIVALARAERAEGRAYLVLAALLAGGAAFFKVFTGAQLLLALGIAWLLGHGRRPLAPVLALAGLALAALAWSAAFAGGAGAVAVRFVPFAAGVPALEAFGLEAKGAVASAAAGVAWLLLSLGLRVAGIPHAWRALREGGPARSALAAFALCGWPLAACFSITADPAADESFYLMEASGLALWLFALPSLQALALRSRVAALAALLLTLPSTVELVARKARQPPEPIPAAAVEAMRALRAASCPGDVVITRPLPSWVPLPMVLGERRVVYSNYLGYWRQFIDQGALAQRDRLLRSFFRAGTADEARALARALGGSFVYLTGRQRVDFEPRGVLQPLFERDGERVYRIVPPAAAGCGAEAASGAAEPTKR